MGVAVASGPRSPAIVRRYDPAFIPAYLSNGLIGLRVGKIPQLEGLAMVSGLAAIHPVDRVEGFARAPYPLAGDLEIDGARLSERPETARFLTQEYDFSCGELRSQYRFAPGAAAAEVEVLTFCSRSLPAVVLQQTRVRVDRACDLALSARIDQRGIDGSLASRDVASGGGGPVVIDGTLEWRTHGGLATCGAAYVTELRGDDDARPERDAASATAPLTTTYRLRARAGRWYTLRAYASLLPSAMHAQPHLEAGRMAARAALLGHDQLRRDGRAIWSDLWAGRIVLEGAGARWQELADAAFYYLHASAHGSSLFSTSMFGLAYWPNYHYYRGQVMWDIEAFAFLPLVLGQPTAARAVLDYRYEHRLAAERNAALHGRRGLQFPWASTPLGGEEGIRTDAPLVFFEEHVGLSVALAFARYVHVTGDQDYLRDRAWPVLEGVAQWIESRWTRGRGGYRIRGTLGIDEQRDHPVDDPAAVSMAAVVVLREAAAAARRLGRGRPAEWERLAAGIRIPRDTRRPVLKSNATFTARASGRGPATPEPLFGLWPIGYPVDQRTERETSRFYLDRVDPYLGSPMLSAILGVHAARSGDRRGALRLLERGYAEFMNPPFNETDEYSRVRFPDRPRVGPFMANIGGFLMSCLLGFPGIEIGPGDPRGWPSREVRLPAGWERITVERLHIRGREARLEARNGKRARLMI